MGYQSLPITPGWHVFTPSFKSLDGDTYDIKKIYFTKADGSAFQKSGKGKMCRGEIAIQKIGSNGWFLPSYKYYSTLNDDCKAWSSDNGKTITTDIEELELNEAESFAIFNDTGATVNMCVTGAVMENPVVVVPTKWSLIGNSTPNEIELSQIYFMKADGSAFLKSGKGKMCRGEIAIQKIGTEGYFQTNYKWYSTLNDECKAWSTDNGKTVTTEKVTLVAGEAFVINNDTGAEVLMVLPSPIK